MRTLTLLIGILAALPAAALAQGGNFVTVTGTVAKIENDTMTVATDHDATKAVKLSPKLIVVHSTPATLGDIQSGDFVASAAVRKEDGKLHSTELRIFPKAMRGIGEGQHPMNDKRHQIMTNATVTGTVITGGGKTLHVKFPGGKSELVVDPGVPLTKLVKVDRDRLIFGTRVRLRARKTADGLSAAIVTVE